MIHQNRDPEENVILKKPAIKFHARVIDECHVGIGTYPNISSAYYVRIKPIAKIVMFGQKDGKQVLSNKMIKIPHWIFDARKLKIPKKDSIIVVTGYYGQVRRSLEFFFQIISYENSLKEFQE